MVCLLSDFNKGHFVRSPVNFLFAIEPPRSARLFRPKFPIFSCGLHEKKYNKTRLFKNIVAMICYFAYSEQLFSCDRFFHAAQPQPKSNSIPGELRVRGDVVQLSLFCAVLRKTHGKIEKGIYLVDISYTTLSTFRQLPGSRNTKYRKNEKTYSRTRHLPRLKPRQFSCFPPPFFFSLFRNNSIFYPLLCNGALLSPANVCSVYVQIPFIALTI